MKNWFLLTIVLFFSFPIIEILLSLTWTNPYKYESSDSFVHIKIQPANTNRIYDVSIINREKEFVNFRTDNRSYITGTFDLIEKPDHKIFFFGGSTTESAPVKEDLRFPILTGKLLRDKNLKINSYNVARNGINIHDSINILFNHVIYDKPTIAVLMHATNDIGTLNNSHGYKIGGSETIKAKNLIKWTLKILSSKSSIFGLMRKFYNRSNFAPYLQNNPNVFNSYQIRSEEKRKLDNVDEYISRIKTFISICKSFDIIPVLLTQPLSNIKNSLTPGWADNHNQIIFNDIIRNVGKNEGSLVIDLVQYLEENVPDWDKPNKVFYDGMHYNNNGSQLVAQHIADTIFSYLTKNKF